MIDEKTLIDFPTEFVIKVFGPNEKQFIDDIINLVNTCCEQGDRPSFSKQFSKNNKYISISVSVYVTSKSNLDKIYQALTSYPKIKMVI